MSNDDKPAAAGEEEIDRRDLLTTLGAGLVSAALGIPLVMSVRSCLPNALYEAPQRFKAGPPEGFSQGPTFFADRRVFVFRQQNTFYCISAVCTHLGCTVQLARQASAGGEDEIEFHCPCHGSKYTADGVPYTGPAPQPLAYYELAVAPDDGQLVVDIGSPADRGWRLTV